jgi:hypothetical protein
MEEFAIALRNSVFKVKKELFSKNFIFKLFLKVHFDHFKSKKLKKYF